MAPATAPDNDASASLVAVTGASGHVGANLVRALVASRRRVRVLVHESTGGIDGLPVEIVRGDVRDPASLAGAFAGVDVVYHLAAKISAGWEPVASVREVNIEGPRNVAQACLAARVRRLVHFSSIHAFAPGPGEGSIEEACPLAQEHDLACGSYGIAKAEGERVIQAAVAAGLDAVILNPTAILGPFDFQVSAMGEVLLALARGKLPALVADASYDFVDVRDVVSSALAAATRGRRGEHYLLPGTRLSLVELAGLWAKACGRPAPRWAAPMWLARVGAQFAPSWARWRGRRPLFTSESLRVLRDRHPVSGRKAETELGHRARPLAETLRDTFAWMKAEGWT
jgi:dihydroflavonol-4-reductase